MRAGDAREILLDDNRISRHQRELMERPENYLRPIRVREYWRPPGIDDNELPEELEPVSAAREKTGLVSV
jgi:hypothetical protein